MKDKRTIIHWNCAYESKIERKDIICPNCGSTIERESGLGENPPKNGLNFYWCANCEVSFVLHFRDLKEEDIPLISPLLGRVFVFLTGLFSGMTLLVSLWWLGGVL